jgi:hypothetical protein
MKHRSGLYYEGGGPEWGQDGQLLDLALFWTASRILEDQPYSGRAAVFWEASRILGGQPHSGRPAVFWGGQPYFGRPSTFWDASRIQHPSYEYYEG